MIIKQLSVSVAGKEHSQHNEPGQDCCRSGAFRFKGQDYFVGIVADGAGSTTHGGIGAEIACERMYMQIVSMIRREEPLGDVTDEELRNWITTTRETIAEEAQNNNLQINDYACTLIGVITSNDHAIYFQIGDGCIVTSNESGYKTVFWPERGEYANTTYFLSESSYVEHIKTKHEDTVPNEIALFTDGIQDLVLSYADETVHEGFFRPLFTRFRESSDEGSTLATYLTKLFLSDEINARSDDDKTLVLAINN
jgi:hypothetical protein